MRVWSSAQLCAEVALRCGTTRRRVRPFIPCCMWLRCGCRCGCRCRFAAQRRAAERASCTGEAKFLLGSVLLEFGLHAEARTALLEAEVLKPNLRDDQIRELAQLLARTTGGP